MNLQHRHNSPMMMRLTSLATALFFSCSTVAWAQPQTFSVLSAAGLASPAKPIPAIAAALSPYGELQQAFEGHLGKTIVLIQDAHVQSEAQEHIAAMIDRFAREAGISLVNVEGSSGRLIHRPFAYYPDAKARESVARHFLEKGQLTGPEYLAIAHRPELTLFGIETQSLYEANRRIFLQTLQFQEHDLKILKDVTSILNAAAPHVLSEDLLEIFQLKQKVASDFHSFSSLVVRLDQLAKSRGLPPQKKYKELPVFLESVQLEKKVDLIKAGQQLEKMIPDASPNLSAQEMKRLKALYGQRNENGVSRAGTYQEILLLFKKLSLKIPKGSAAAAYLKYLGLTSRLSAKLFDEAGDFEQAVTAALLRDDNEKNLFTLFRVTEAMKHLFALSWTRQDVAYYEAHQDLFNSAWMVKTLKVLFEKAAFQDGLPENLADLDQHQLAAIQFYRIALKRDQALIQNALQQMDVLKQNKSILVVGGFHAAGIASELERQGYSYVMLTPTLSRPVDEITQNKKYRAAIQRQWSALPDLLRNQSLSLTDARTQMAPSSALMTADRAAKVGQAVRQHHDLISVLRQDPELAFGVLFGLFLQLEDFTANGSRPPDFLSQVQKHLQGTDLAVSGLLYETLLPPEMQGIAGADSHVTHVAGRELFKDTPFAVDIRSDSKERNQSAGSYRFGGTLYDLKFQPDSRAPIQLRSADIFEDVFLAPRQKTGLVPPSSSRMPKTSLFQNPLSQMPAVSRTNKSAPFSGREKVAARARAARRSEVRSGYREFIPDDLLREAHSPNPTSRLTSIRKQITEGAIQYFAALRERNYFSAIRGLLGRKNAPGEIFRAVVDSEAFDWRIMTKGARPRLKVGPNAEDQFSFADHHEWIYEALVAFSKGDYAALLDRFSLPEYRVSWVHHYFSPLITVVSRIPVLKQLIPLAYFSLTRNFIEWPTRALFKIFPSLEAAVNVLGIATLKIKVYDPMPQRTRNIAEVAVAIHDLGKLVTMGPVHPRIGGELAPHLLNALNGPVSESAALTDSEMQLITALTALEGLFGTIPAGEAGPEKLLEELKQMQVSAADFMPIMALIFLLDAGSSPTATDFERDSLVRNGKRVPKKGFLSYNVLKDTVLLSSASNVSRLSHRWAERVLESYYDFALGDDYFDLDMPLARGKVHVPAMGNQLIHSSESFRHFLERSSSRGVLYWFRYLAEKSPQNLLKFIYLFSTLYDSEHLDSYGLTQNNPEIVDLINTFLERVPDASQLMAQGWRFVRGVDQKLLLQNGQGTSLAVMDYAYDPVHKEIEIFMATWRATGRSEVRTSQRFDTSDQAVDQIQREYEAARDDSAQGGFFGKDQSGPYFGLYKQDYMLNRAMTDPRFYLDAMALYVPESDAVDAQEILNKAKEHSLPPYTFIFRLNEAPEIVRERFDREQALFPDIRLVPIGIVSGDVPGTMSGAVWARRQFRDFIETHLGYHWNDLKIKGLFLAWGSGGRIFPMGEFNKILANSPMSDESYLALNMRGILQYIVPGMKKQDSPGHNFVIYPDSLKFLDREAAIGAHDFELIGSLVSHDQSELSELGVGNIDADNRITSFVEKAQDATEIRMRLGPGTKFRSFGDNYMTDQFADLLEQHIDPLRLTYNSTDDFAIHLVEPATLIDQGQQKTTETGAGISTAEWLRTDYRRFDKIKNVQAKEAYLSAVRHIVEKEGMVIGVATGGITGEFIHSNSIPANKAMMARLGADPFYREVAGLQADSQGRIIGPDVVLGPHVEVEPNVVILGSTFIGKGKIKSGSVVRNTLVAELHTEGDTLVNSVDARAEILRVPAGFMVNDVFVNAGGQKRKIRYARRTDEDINAPVLIRAVVITTGSLRDPSTEEIDPEAITAIKELLDEPESPYIVFISHHDFETTVALLDLDHFSVKQKEKIRLYTSNGATLTGFTPQGTPQEFFTHDFKNRGQLKQRIQHTIQSSVSGRGDGQKKTGFSLKRDSAGFLSYEINDKKKIPAIFEVLNRQYQGQYEISIYGNQIRISLMTRESTVQSVIDTLRLTNRPHQRILVIGESGGKVVVGKQRLPVPDDNLLRTVEVPRFAGRVSSLAVGVGGKGLSLAVEKPIETSHSKATIQALREIQRLGQETASGNPSWYRDWRLVGNSLSMQNMIRQFDRVASKQFERDRKAFVDDKRRLAKRSEVRQVTGARSSQLENALLAKDAGRLALLLQVSAGKPGTNATATASQQGIKPQRISAADRWFQRLFSRDESASLSRPSFYITDWDRDHLDLADVQSLADSMSYKSTLILLVSERERAGLLQKLNDSLVLKGGKRILLASQPMESVVLALMSDKQYHFEPNDVYWLRLRPEIEKLEGVYHFFWHGAKALLYPGRIVVFSRQPLQIEGSHSITMDAGFLHSLLQSLESSELSKESA